MAVHVKLTLSPNTAVTSIGGEVILGSAAGVRDDKIIVIS